MTTPAAEWAAEMARPAEPQPIDRLEAAFARCRGEVLAVTPPGMELTGALSAIGEARELAVLAVREAEEKAAAAENTLALFDPMTQARVDARRRDVEATRG